MNKHQKFFLLCALAWFVGATMRMQGYSWISCTIVFVLIAVAAYYQE